MQPRRLNIDSHRAASGVGEILGLLGGAVRGAANLPRAVKEEGASGVVQAFTDPQRFEGERRNEKYISQLAEDSMQQRIHVRELLTSDQPIEALKFAMTTREMLGMNHPGVPDEVIDKVMAPEMEMVKRTLYDPRRLGTPEQAAKLSAFVGGTPKDLRESARTQAYAGTQGAYQGKAEEETRTERETRQPRIEKLGAETQKNRSMASFYEKGGGERGGAGDRLDRLRDDLRSTEIEIAKQLGGTGTAETLGPLVSQANQIRQQLNMNPAEIAQGAQGQPLFREVTPPPEPGAEMPPEQQYGNPETGATMPQAPPPTAQPEQTVTSRARNIFGEAISASRAGHAIYIKPEDAMARLQQAGITDPAEQQAVMAEAQRLGSETEGPAEVNTPSVSGSLPGVGDLSGKAPAAALAAEINRLVKAGAGEPQLRAALAAGGVRDRRTQDELLKNILSQQPRQ